MAVDYSKLSPELQDKLKQWEDNSPAGRQLASLTSLTEKFDQFITLTGKTSQNDAAQARKEQELLLAIGRGIKELSAKETPETPDFAKPITVALARLEDSLTKAIAQIDVKPDISVTSPSVSVPRPEVNVTTDLSGVEKILRTDIPAAFAEAINSIPAPDAPDNSTLIEALTQIQEQLSSIDVGTRMKVQFPDVMRVTSDTVTLTERYDYDDATTLYTASAPRGTAEGSASWSITKYDLTDTNNASATIATDVSWTNRTSGTYS